MTPRGALQAEGSCGDRHLPKPCAPHPCPVKTLQKQWVETLGASYGMRTFVLSGEKSGEAGRRDWEEGAVLLFRSLGKGRGTRQKHAPASDPCRWRGQELG